MIPVTPARTNPAAPGRTPVEHPVNVRPLGVEPLESRDTPAAFTGVGFATGYLDAYGFVGGVQDAYVTGPDGATLHVLAGGAGSGPRVVVEKFDGPDAGEVVADFFAFEEGFRGGVVLESVSTPGGDRLLVGAGPGGAPIVRQFDAATGREVAPVLAYGDPEVDRMGVAYLSSTAGAVYATLGEGAGPRLQGFDAVTGEKVADLYIGPADDRSGDYRPFPAGLGVGHHGFVVAGVDDPATGDTALYDLATGVVVG